MKPSNQAIVERRVFSLPKGGDVEFEIMPGFYEKVREQLQLAPDTRVSDDHLRMFLYGAVNSAVEKQGKKKL